MTKYLKESIFLRDNGGYNMKQMKNKLLILLLLFFTVFACLSNVSAATFTNQNTLDEIQNFISTSADDTLIFQEGNYEGLNNLNVTRELTIKNSGNVNIKGDGSADSLLFNISAEKVSIEGLKITEYNTTIYSTASKLTLKNNVISIDELNSKAIIINNTNGDLQDIILENNIIDTAHILLLEASGNIKNLLIQDNKLMGITSGITFKATQNITNITIRNNKIKNIVFNASNIQDIFISNNSIDANGGITLDLTAIGLVNNITIKNNTLVSQSYSLKLFSDKISNIHLDGNEITSSAGHVIYLKHGTSLSNLTLKNNTISISSSKNGLHIESDNIAPDIYDNENISVFNNTFNNKGTNCINIIGNIKNLNITKNLFPAQSGNSLTILNSNSYIKDLFIDNNIDFKFRMASPAPSSGRFDNIQFTNNIIASYAFGSTSTNFIVNYSNFLYYNNTFTAGTSLNFWGNSLENLTIKNNNLPNISANLIMISSTNVNVKNIEIIDNILGTTTATFAINGINLENITVMNNTFRFSSVKAETFVISGSASVKDINLINNSFGIGSSTTLGIYGPIIENVNIKDNFFNSSPNNAININSTNNINNINITNNTFNGSNKQKIAIAAANINGVNIVSNFLDTSTSNALLINGTSVNSVNISYNVILFDTIGLRFIGSGSNNLADYNWWGTNNITEDIANKIIGLDINSYYTMLLYSEDELFAGDSFQYLFTLNETDDIGDVDKLPYIETVIEGQGDDIVIDGRHNIDIVLNSIGTYNIIATLHSQISELNVEVKKSLTTIEIDDFEGKKDQELNLTIRLVNKNSNPISDLEVEFYVGGTLVGSNYTDIDGIAIFAYTPSVIGDYLVLAKFSGDINYQESEDSSTLSVSEIPLSSIVINNLNGEKDKEMNLIATLKDNNNDPINGRLVEFYVNNILVGYNYTDTDGIATLAYTPSAIGDLTVLAKFSGDSNYQKSESSSKLTVNGDNTQNNGNNGATNNNNNNNGATNNNVANNNNNQDTTNTNIYQGYSAPTSTGTTSNNQVSNNNVVSTTNNLKGTFNKSLKLTSGLKDAKGNPVKGEILYFYVNNKLVGNATTNEDGIAILNYKVLKTGNATVKVVYKGNSNYVVSNSNYKLVVPKSAIVNVKSVKSVKKNTLIIKNTLVNVGYDKATFKVYYKLPKGVTYSKPKVSTGKVSFNKKTHVVTWTISNLKGKKSKTVTLNWKMKTKKGAYDIKPTFSKAPGLKTNYKESLAVY